MEMKKAIQKYLERHTKNDSALAGKFDASKMDECVRYVTGLARKELHGNSGAIDDATVYKWARDFFLEGPADEGKEECGTEEKVTGNAYQLSFDFGG